MKQIVFIFLFLSGFNILLAQTASNKAKKDSECYSYLKEAENDFQNGQFTKCISDLEWSLQNCHLSKNEKVNSLELLAKSYIELDKTEKADSAVKILLKTNPFYELKEDNNSEDYNRLVKKYDVHPRFSIGVRNTYNTIKYKTTKVNSVLNTLDYSAPYNHNGAALFYYGYAEYEFKKDISINMEGIFFWSSFNRVITKDPSFYLYFYEKDNFFEMPIYLKKYFHPTKNLISYVSLGAVWLRITNTTANISVNYTNYDNITTANNYDYSAYINNLDVKESRNLNIFEWTAGAGIGYQIKNLKLFLDIRYMGGLNSFTNSTNGSKNSILINDFYYIDNSVKLNQFEFGASISYTLKYVIKRK